MVRLEEGTWVPKQFGGYREENDGILFISKA